ncbi:MAG TPA: bacteriohemerythrin [Candidatus Binataceae bacterium]|nr:bacteriohemerythrin [Candidatus Binataceae bacterium]
MPFFEWKDDLTVGHPMIDRDHKMLIQYVNEMHEAMMSGKGKAIVGAIIAKLVAYTKEHFGREEIFWKSRGYVEFDAHKKRHVDLLAKVNRYQADYDSGSTALSVELMNFMRDWLTGHILKSDKEAFRAISAGKPAQAAPAMR